MSKLGKNVPHINIDIHGLAIITFLPSNNPNGTPWCYTTSRRNEMGILQRKTNENQKRIYMSKLE